VSAVSSVVACLISAAFIFIAAAPASAQMGGTVAPGYKQEPGQASTALPTALREIGFDQNLNQRVPLDTEFTDESGRW
jgi:hypothetical protein